MEKRCRIRWINFKGGGGGVVGPINIHNTLTEMAPQLSHVSSFVHHVFTSAFCSSAASIRSFCLLGSTHLNTHCSPILFDYV